MNNFDLIEKIQDIRKTKVITYITSDRPGIISLIEESFLRELYDHLKTIKGQDIDLFLYSRGGTSVVAWATVNLIREYAKKFNVLIPYRAHSCATAIAIGADKIVMGSLAELGPVDPTVPFTKQGQRLEVSVEDLSGYVNFLMDKFNVTKEEQKIKAFEKLAEDASPLALGRSYREYIKAREDTKKLLKFAYAEEAIDKITGILVEKLYSHYHMINRKEAKELVELNVDFANAELEEAMWNLYLNYENELSLKIPYEDELPTSGNFIDVPLAVVESENLKSIRNSRQWYSKLRIQPNAQLIIANNQTAVLLPNGNILGIQSRPGTNLTSISDVIYEKKESVLWDQKAQKQK